jgi:hypothetical protein
MDVLLSWMVFGVTSSCTYLHAFGCWRYGFLEFQVKDRKGDNNDDSDDMVILHADQQSKWQSIERDDAQSSGQRLCKF